MFVSGLPRSFSDDQLKGHFASHFQVTDAHVLPKRRIGFVGFKNASAAKQAVAYFNKTYIRMSKIAVDIARPVCLILHGWNFLALCSLTNWSDLLIRSISTLQLLA